MVPPDRLSVDVLSKAVTQARLTKLGECLGLDLAHPLAADPELFADLAKGTVTPVFEPEAHPEHLSLPTVQLLQGALDLELEHRLVGRFGRGSRPPIGDEVGDRVPLVLANWRLQGD